MITKQNFPKLLHTLGFQENNQIFSKMINDSELKVDFKNEKLIYPDGITADRDTTKNFSQNENFVVFECVHNLLVAGYQPKNIVLEKGMYTGHGMTGGFCDIIVQDNSEKPQPYLLIECKNADDEKNKEFSRAWAKMKEDGGQLFSYYITNLTAQWLCLYSSDFRDNNVEQIYHLISMEDNDAYLQDHDALQSFRSVREKGGKSDYFDVWKNTYQQDFRRYLY